MRDFVISDAIHDGFHKNGSPFIEHEREMDKLIFEILKKVTVIQHLIF